MLSYYVAVYVKLPLEVMVLRWQNMELPLELPYDTKKEKCALSVSLCIDMVCTLTVELWF